MHACRSTLEDPTNFAYELCARRVTPDPGKLDLSSWDVATNGAEPVRAETLERFAARFAPCGFRREAFYPAYGLAEATLKVSGGARGEGPKLVRVSRAALESGRAADRPDGIELVGSGRAAEGTRVTIVDPESERERAENEVGEIRVSGPGVARGYWNRESETEATFGVHAAEGRTRFLRTGDLGFLRGGELYVTGRAKDMVIVRGRNIYPQDVESAAVSSDPSLAASPAAAFGVDDEGGERLAIVVEVPRHALDPAALLRAVRAGIVETLEVDPGVVVLVRTGGVPRTSSGKVRRGDCRRALLEGALPVVAEWRAASGEAPGTEDADIAPGATPKEWLVWRISAMLGTSPATLDLAVPPAAHGIDSLRSIELAHEIARRFAVDVSVTEFLAAPSLDSIADAIDERRARAAGSMTPGASAESATSTTTAKPRERERLETPARTGPFPRVPGAGQEPEECALSAGQKALWFLHELFPQNSSDTIAMALALDGPLDEAAFARAARALIDRHASLRARFVPGEAGPRQRFDVPFESIFERAGLEPVADADRAARLADLAYRPFDLSSGPLFRLSLLDEGGARILLLAAHHAVTDLWSLSLILRDLAALYAAGIGAGPALVTPAPHPADWIRRRTEWLGGEFAERQLAWWKERLAPPRTPLELPTDRPRPAVRSLRGGAVARPLDPELTRALRRLARERRVTLFALLLAAYQVFLWRMTGKKEVLVGVPASGRTDPADADLVAFLVNAVVLRADLSGDPSFEEHLARARGDLFGALENDELPFSVLVKRLAPERDPSRSPLFDTMFDLHAAADLVRGGGVTEGGRRTALGGGVTATPLAIERRAAQFDLSVTVMDDGEALLLEMEYAADLFERETVSDLARRYEILLKGIVAEPEQRLSRLPVMGPDERARALEEGNARAGVAAAADVQEFHRLFERQAARHPETIAAWSAGERIVYGDLNRRANALARRLRALGVGPETRVALGLGKSIDLLVALLGVLKAGGAYVPLDPSLPMSRRRAIVESAGVRVVLAREAQVDDFGPGVLVLGERDWSGLDAGGREGEDLTEGPFPENLAYVISTSGTTGAPKSVGVSHASLIGVFHAWDRAYGLGTLPVHLQMAAPSFDVFTGDVARALGSGGSLVLCDRDVLLDPASLAALARAHGAAFAEFVPAVLRELAAYLVRTGERLDTLQFAVVGSDTWTMADHALFRRALGPKARILNSYGVTEATIDSACVEVTDADRLRATPPCGRPLANSAVHVLDANLDPVPPGVRGYLYLGGTAVARGYVGQPDLTAERFVPDPHGPAGARLYRTGDAGRRLPDGRLMFEGRTDAQIKIRGMRIESVEIESVLESHPKVRAAAVGVRESPSGRRLVAWVIAPGAGPDLAQELRDRVSAQLPDAMTPSAIVMCSTFPLNASGKVDRSSLPEPSWGAQGQTESPATETERILARIFAQVLGVADVGRDGHFFRLGGDSILAIQVVARAREEGLALTPRRLFEHPIVESLARAATRDDGRGPADASSGAEGRLLPIQRWFFEQAFDEPDHWNMTIALEAAGPLDPELAHRACRAVVDRHEALRTRFEGVVASGRAVVDPPGGPGPAFAAIDPAPDESPEEAAGRCVRRLSERIRLVDGPVAGFGLVSARPGGPALFVVVVHHLVVDGVSLRILVEDFERAYVRLGRGESAGLAAPRVSTGRWTRGLEEAVREGRFDGEIAHYRGLAERAATSSACLSTPASEAPSARGESAAGARVDVPPRAAEGSAGASADLEGETAMLRVSLDAVETGALLAALASRGVGVETGLLAALARSTPARQPLYVELEGHGRDTLADLDATRTVGWFTETRPVLIDGLDPDDADGAVRAVTAAVRAASSGGFGALRYLSDDASVRESLARVPAPPIAFNYLGRFGAEFGPDALFIRVFEPAAPARSPRARRTHALEIDASVLGGVLGIRWSWSPGTIEAAAIARWSDDLLAALRAYASPMRDAALAEGDETLPLTPMQEGMLFHHLRARGKDPYVSQLLLELTGDLDTEALARAWRFAAQAHPSLRAAFVWEEVPRPVQVLRADVSLPVLVHDLDEDAVDALMARRREEGFDVARAPLARIDLVRTGSRRLQMLFTHHHLLLDGWSLPIVLETVFQAYEEITGGADVGSIQGAAPSLARGSSPRPYLEWLATKDAAVAESFFKDRLAGARPTLAPDPSGMRFAAGADEEGDRAPAPYEGSAVAHARAPEGVRERARALGLTPASVYQAAWAIVLASALGERDVVFGSTSSGRPAEVPGIASAVGLFINTLPLRVRVDPRAPAAEFVRTVQSEASALRQHEHAPLSLAQKCAGIAAGTPLFETLLVFENYPIDVAALGRRSRFEVTGLRLHEESNYPLTIVVEDTGEPGLRAIYDRARYDDAAARTLLGRLAAAVEGVLSRPEASLEEIPRLSREESERVLVRWNETRRDFPRESTIVRVFDEVARDRAEKVALAFEDGVLTYRELAGRSRRLARALGKRGAGPESRVGLAMQRSADLIVAILGILRAGGAYVPIDPDSPATRTARMLEDAGVRLVLTDGAVAVPPADGLEAVGLAELLDGAGPEDPEANDASENPGSPDNLAYVMFTSGSTGEPKGIEITQRGVLRLVRGTDYVRFGPAETILQFAPIPFDLSTFDLWGALLNGGRLAIAPPGTGTPSEIIRLVERYGVTTLWLTAGLFRIVVEEEPEALARVPQLLAGGDVVSAPHVRRLFECGAARIVNGYGPTEATTFACCHSMTSAADVGPRVSIGRPIANTTVYVLDDAMRLVPVGAAGELYIGGDGLARGYSRRPDLTAERFLPDPFGPPGSRLYRSGDLVRWRADGRLDFLGRRDGQAKIRGFRIELGEVEAALAECPGVRNAAAALRGPAGEIEVVAYVVPERRGGGDGDAPALRQALAGRLPRYMMPSRFVFLEALPLTAIGKVDRRALPDPGSERAAAPARTRTLDPVEDAVSGVWRRVLGDAPGSPDEDFFDWGGDSLQAIRLLAALRRAFRIDLPMDALLDAATIAGIARALQAREPRPGHVARAAAAFAKMRSMTEGAPAPDPRAGDAPISPEAAGGIDGPIAAGPRLAPSGPEGGGSP